MHLLSLGLCVQLIQRAGSRGYELSRACHPSGTASTRQIAMIMVLAGGCSTFLPLSLLHLLEGHGGLRLGVKIVQVQDVFFIAFARHSNDVG